jgi:hypothetical protein
LKSLVRALRDRCGQRVLGLSKVQVVVREEPGACPLCGGPMQVQKSIPRQGCTLDHGTFLARETVHACPAGRHEPGGALVIRRARALRESLIPGRSVGYDVMVLVGMERYLRHRQREEIRETLRSEHGIQLSAGTISELALLFGNCLRALHEARADQLRAALERDGGWPMHIDATGENGRGTLLVAYAGWRRWVLGAWRIPTERADAILPRLREVVGVFGPPCAIVRDLGRAMIPAAADLVAELGLPIPILACHAHFLADIGRDLLEPGHDVLRRLFRKAGVRPDLRILARDLGRTLGVEIPRVREAVTAWMAAQDDPHTLPEARPDALGVVRAMAQWVLDYPADATGADFPFDRPYLDLYDRCVRARRALDAFLRKPPGDKEVRRVLGRLARVLDSATVEPSFAQAAGTLRRRADLFDELRAALRLFPARGDTSAHGPATSPQQLQDIQAAVQKLTISLQERRPQRGPAQDTRQAIDQILAHLDRHGSSLWGHTITLPDEAGGGHRLVPRTNNLLESFYRAMKQGERRRSGRRTLADDLEHLPPEAALARNLLCPDYVEIICGSIQNLPHAFADLDAQGRLRNITPDPAADQVDCADAPEIATASLPRLDRRLVRSPAMTSRILAAARSRAPRVSTAPLPCW